MNFMTIAEATKIYEDLKPKVAKAKAESEDAESKHKALYAKAKRSSDPQSFAQELEKANNDRKRLKKIYEDLLGEAIRAKMDIAFINSGNGRNNLPIR